VARRVSSPVLVGRAAEAAQLRAALERAAAGQPAIVVVAGEAGIGKTRLWRQAEALLAQGAPRPAAGAALAKAWNLAGGLGARLLVAEIDSLSRRVRIELAGPPDDPAAAATATDELGLTPREREVLALVSDGRTNRQIAEALFISDKTASVHVSNILAKLGVANRGEAVAHRLRLTG
jgi:DNA-binding NarL/FixJ family response regulator